MADRRSTRTEITRQEYAQLLGLRLLADKYNQLLHDIQAAALVITQELNYPVTPTYCWKLQIRSEENA